MSNDEVFNDEQIEDSLEDLEKIDNWANGAVLWSTDWTAETVISQLNRNNIDLDPSFQRRSAWTDKKQSLFIESLILGLPIPQLILAEAHGKKGSFIVIDGKQRLLAIRRFGSSSSAGGFTPLQLKGLSELKQLNGKTYNDLMSDPNLDDFRSAFENSSIRTIVIRNWQNESYLYEVFLRINTGSVQLSPQELRQALHPGPFSTFINDTSGDSPGIRKALNLKAPDFRMRDAEILLRFLAYRNFIRTYNGNLKFFLDETTRKLNLEWGNREIEINDQCIEMENAFSFTENIFTKKHYLRKWNGNNFESRKNRAIFDIMLYYFSFPELRERLAGKETDIENKFKFACDNNSDFLSSIENTTKSMEANKCRFNVWGDILSSLSGLNLDHLKFSVPDGHH
ncbi:hypothetical protein CFR80_17255 [Komagataeibacter oboediens]|uniref:GmrSD restriction endonucleases N-terminal domain-containing protein n=1 Tax=Komagataeibacter oboediens TaxID=65958 RepID=A0A318QK73_9PROT|nr:DUF262 domain-containing protein [Komagataeibacter oboediens]PYD77891.1 hypothetical protein CFR80_17255 [Komagataeibacter oboediens]